MPKTQAAPLTEADLERTLRDDRHIGFGYAERSVMTPREQIALGEAVIARANELGWDYETLFRWSNARQARWLVDEVVGDLPAIPRAVARYVEVDD